jgi:hypothetical protein
VLELENRELWKDPGLMARNRKPREREENAMRRNWMSPLILVGLALLATPAFAAGDLADAVPGDAVVVVRVTGLQAQWKQFLNSPTWKKLEQSSIPELAAGILMARQQIEVFEQQTAASVEDCLGSIFGTDFALAMLPDKTAFFIARTPDVDKLQCTIDLLHSIETNDGKLLRDSVEAYQGVDIHTDVLANPGPGGPSEKQRHYAQTGDLLIVSENLPAVRRVLDATLSKAPSLSNAAKYVEASKSLRSDALVRVYVDSSRLAQSVDLESGLNECMQNLAVRTIALRAMRFLPLTQYIVGDAVVTGDQLEARYAIAYDEQKLPESLRALLPPSNASLNILNLIPPTAIFAYANQFDKLAFWRYAVESVREENPEAAETLTARANMVGAAMGALNFEKEFLPQFGSQNALIVTPGTNQNPPGVCLMLEMKNPSPIAITLKALAGTATALNQAEAQNTGTPVKTTLTRTTYRDTDLTTLELKEPKFGGKLNPTLCVTGNFLVLTSTPEAAQLILDTTASPAAPTAKREGALLSSGRLDVSALVALLEQYRELLIQKSVADGKTEVQARKDLLSLQFLLGLVRRIDVHSTVTHGRIERTMLISF